MKKQSLRAWLRRAPEPSKVKVRLEDGEERDITIPADIRNRWKTVETTVLASNAVAVSLFDKKGALLRAQPLDTESEEDEEASTPEGKAHAAQSRNMKEWTGMLQAVMHEQNVSFEKGVAAAAQSQDSLVELVDGLGNHLATAFTSLHNIVASMAQMQQIGAEREAQLTKQLAEASTSDDGKDSQLTQAIGSMLAGALGVTPPAPAQSNGKKAR
jgi:hypothetical protein